MSAMPNIRTRTAFSPADLGKLVRAERKARGRTQQEVAAIAGVRRQTISDLESGSNASVHTLMTVLAALDQGVLLTTKQMNVDRIHELLDGED